MNTWIVSMLRTTPDRWLSLTTTLPEELLRLAPAPGKWSAQECLQHMIDIDSLYQFRVRELLAERDIPNFDPDREEMKPRPQKSPLALAHDFAELRRVSLSAILDLTPAEMSRTARHEDLGPVTLGDLLHEWAAHDLIHLRQAEHAIMQPFLRNCGPWQKYCEKYVAG